MNSTREELIDKARNNIAESLNAMAENDIEGAAVYLNSARALVDMAIRIERDGIKFTSMDIMWGDGNAPNMITIPEREE